MEPRPLNHVSFLIIQSAIQIHRALGPGLLESIYRACMIYELQERGMKVAAEQLVPIRYRDVVSVSQSFHSRVSSISCFNQLM